MNRRVLLCLISLAWLGLALMPVSSRAEESPPPAGAGLARPRLVDLGARQCIPCKLMKPILDELSREYADQFDVVFIDVREKRNEAKRYRIRVIPTQIFYDAEGQERYRHEGFMSKADILGKWKELGLVLKEPASD